MNQVIVVLGIATLTFAVGMWLMLPRGGAPGRALGTVLVGVALGLIAWQTPPFGPWATEWADRGVFYILAGVTVFSAVATVTFRSPVYSAIWFALTLLGTAGLFLYDGAQFLGVATIVVYAGAILVTFLFVLMLAQPEGQAFYDRLSWGALLSAVTGAVMVGVLTLTLAAVFQNPNPEARPEARFDAADLSGDILAREHMARLGSELFSKYLVGVEVAGTLLLVALVGTVAIVAQIRKPHAGANSDA